jgi:hypothetical protein
VPVALIAAQKLFNYGREERPGGLRSSFSDLVVNPLDREAVGRRDGLGETVEFGDCAERFRAEPSAVPVLLDPVALAAGAAD